MKRICITTITAFIILFNMQNTILAQDKLKIVIIPKSNNALFWKSVRLGAKLGATALSNVEIIWDAPVNEDNLDQQISIFEKHIKDGASGIILSPIHQDALAKPVTKAMNKNIPVLIFDSPLKGVPGKDFISFVGINNRKAGYLAGKHMVSILNGRGKVALIRVIKNQANTTEREEGFLEAIAKYDNIKVTIKDCYVGGNVDEIKKISTGMLNKLQETDGVFCPNELSTVGLLFTFQEAKLAGKIKFIGFDTPPLAVEALKKGEISALIAQDPPSIGFHSVKTIVDYIRGNKIQNNIDIDVQVVTRENINQPEIQKLLALPNITQ
jgi:ribose transport system substrate-binding protein